MIIPITFAVGYNGDIFDENRIIIKSAVIPAASEYTLGDIYCYSGVTNATYTHGYIYECIADGSGYHWERLDVQPPAIVDESDIVDIVANYAALQSYDTSDLDEGNIVVVSSDSTHDGGKAYYQWTNNAWVFKTAEEPYYSKQAADGRFVPLTRTINSKTLDSNITLTASDVNAQAPLTAGDNITIDENNVISAAGGTITPRFSVNKGNVNAQGTMDILSYSGQTLSFKVDDGTTYAPMTCTTGYSGEQFVKEELDSISTSSLSAATYNVFAPKTGTTAYVLNNVILVQPERPSDTNTDVIPTMTSATTPYGTVTTPDGGYWDDYKLFASGEVTCTGTISNSKAIIYTFDESHQPQAGTYKIKYTAPSQYAGYVQKFIITLIDNSQITVSASNKATDFTLTFTCTDTIKSIAFYPHNASYGTRYGRVQLVIPASTDEGTLWVNNGVEPLEVQVRDANAQWQPFDDVLLGTCTVDNSHNITAVANVGFNYFSSVNMHNISTTAHENIRNAIDTTNTNLATLQDTVNRLNTRSACEVVISTIPQTDASLHLADGSLLQGSGIYADFVSDMADKYGDGLNPPSYFVTEVQWQQDVIDYGVCDKFVYDSVNNTLRLPKWGNQNVTAVGNNLSDLRNLDAYCYIVVATVTKTQIQVDIDNVATDLNSKQDKSNLVTSISASSTDDQYPSAKCMYDLIGNIEARINNL